MSTPADLARTDDSVDRGPGLFGPGSMSWRVQADPVAGVGGLGALFLQALHPLAMAGVFEHSSYDADFWPRFSRTAQYVTTVNFGTTAEVEQIAGHVRRMHAYVQGTDPVTGQQYSAGSPELITWVHVTEVRGFLDAVQRGGLGLHPEEEDQYYAEQVQVAQLLGATDVPASRADVADYLADVRPQLVCSAHTRDGARLLLAPPMPWRVQLLTPARPGWAALAGLGFCLLPRWARRLYRLPGLPTTDVGATLAVRGLSTALGALPARYTEGPIVRAAHERTAA